MHAVLESALEDNNNSDGMHEAQKVRNHALIHYLASLANSNNSEDVFDFDFVESLIENGADVNSTDRNGQTIFHEIARSWNLDVALFLLEHGMFREKYYYIFYKSPCIPSPSFEPTSRTLYNRKLKHRVQTSNKNNARRTKITL